ncbi:MAG: DNA-binding transcriptional repressor DeoR [Acetobacter sp.]|nr:DNA-binding transcriptional repressor DeoR [Acetobacter sp.]
METKRAARLHKIRQALIDRETVHLRTMAGELGVSEMTLRRDLADAADDLMLLGGYITSRHETPTYYVPDQSGQQMPEKHKIARIAAGFVQAGDTVFFDCGTTTPMVADAIPDDLPFTAICNSLNVLMTLQKKQECSVILCGGRLHRRNLVFENGRASDVLNGLRISRAFLSAAGIDIQCGITCFRPEEVHVKQQVIAQSKHRFLLADHTKFDVVRPAHFADLNDFQVIISDQEPSAQYREMVEMGGGQFLVATSEK